MMSADILFSVVTVTYNASHTVERTMRSVASQTYGRIEHVVVDGLSSDGTQAIVSRYNPEVFVSRRDKGLYHAMNDAVGLCHGDYVCFLNAGDAFSSPDTLRKVASMIDGDSLPDVIYGQTQIVDDDGTFLGMRRLSAPQRLDWKSFRNGMLVCHQAFWARRGKIVEYNTGYRFSSDFDWCIRIMKSSGILFNTGLTLISYLDGGMTTKNRYASLIERFRIMCRHYGVASTLCHHAWFLLRLPISLLTRRLARQE